MLHLLELDIRQLIVNREVLKGLHTLCYVTTHQLFSMLFQKIALSGRSSFAKFTTVHEIDY